MGADGAAIGRHVRIDSVEMVHGVSPSRDCDKVRRYSDKNTASITYAVFLSCMRRRCANHFVLEVFPVVSHIVAHKNTGREQSMGAYFVVQSFTRGSRGGLRPDVPVQAQNTCHARRMAGRLASQKALVVAFMREGDPKTGEFDEAKLIAAHGEVPDEVREMPVVS